MMKKILVTVCVVAISAGAFAQSVSYGIKAGVNLSTQHLSYTADLNISNKTEFHVGAVADIAIHQFSIQPGLYFITKGYAYDSTDPLYSSGSSGSAGTVTLKGSVRLNYLELPVNLLYHIKLTPDMNLYFGAGPYLGYGLSGKVLHDPTASAPDKSETNISFGSGDSDSYRNPDYGINFMIGQRIKHFTVDVNYSLGLANVAETTQYYKAYNRVLGISAGYMFK